MTASASPMVQVATLSLEQKWNDIRDLDNQRNAVVEVQELLAELKRVNDEVDRLRTSSELSEVNSQALLAQLRDLTIANNTLQRRRDASPFVLVLIDGDNTLFHDRFVQAGGEGGIQAAHALQEALERLVYDSLGFESSTKIMVRIFYNAVGLTTTYERVVALGLFDRFVSSFNAQRRMVEYIDAGQDGQAADNEITDHLAFFWNIESCKHIMLAGSADKGYVGHLRRFTSRREDKERLTLIESTPFPRPFRQLSSSFRTESFPEVFRTTKIEIQDGSRADIPATYAGTVVRAGSSDSSPLATPDEAMGAATQPPVQPQRMISLNRRGQRIDAPLQPYNHGILRDLQKKKLCTRFYLSRCSYIDCKFEHESVLDDAAKRALARLARENACRLRGICRDLDCVAGHHCLHDKCPHGTKCRFDLDQHNMDKTIVQRV